MAPQPMLLVLLIAVLVLCLIGGCLIAFSKGKAFRIILGGILILPLIFVGLAIFSHPSVHVSPPRSAPIAYQPPGNWTNVEDEKSITVSGESVATTRGSALVEEKTSKLWVEDFPKFVNENPQHNWLLAQSPEPCLSVDEAMQRALSQAASQVVSTTGFSVHGADQPMVLKHLEDCGLIQDRFVQKFSRPYGDVWRASLLIDASPKNMDRLNKAITEELTGTKRELRNMIFSTLGLLAVIIGVYYLMDAVTRGYFKTRLRIITVLMAIVGVFLLLFTWGG
jgi:hypothetical protein